MNIKRHTNRLLLTIFALTLASTPIKINAAIPELKGMYELFTPDVIGIGQALKTKGWIENVYLFAPKDNLARLVIEKFWYKPIDRQTREIIVDDLFLIKKNPPVSMITPEIFGEILVFAANIRENKTGKAEKQECIKKDWLAACDEHIKKVNSEPKKKNKIESLNIEINELEQKNNSLDQKKDTKQFKANQKLIIDKLGTLSTLDEKENIGREIDSILENIKKLVENESIVPETIEKKGKKIEKNPDFITGTAEGILWAFFESKFTTKGKKDALKNFLKCLKKVAPDKISTLTKYESGEYKKFEKEIVAEKDKLGKILKEYDRSTYSSIKRARINIVPAEVTQDFIPYKKGTPEETEQFNTCFESALLDTVSILIYDPKNKTYDLKMLPKNTTESKLFEQTRKSVFEYTDEEDKKVNNSQIKFINPEDINTRRQQWIDVIENRPEFNYFKYDKNIGYDFKTTIENFVKFLNAFYNLELNITPNAENLTIDIKNVLEFLKKNRIDSGDAPKDAQDFWNKIFLYVSEKLKTERRTITFTCELNNQPKLELSGDKIETKDSLGKVKIKIEYLEKKDQKFNVEFDLDIAIGHAHATCDIRKACGIKIYDENFKIELAKAVYKSGNNKLFPLFILLANKEMDEKANTKILNLFIYSLDLKNRYNKKDVILIAIKEDIVKNKNFTGLIEKLIHYMPTDDPANADNDYYNFNKMVEIFSEALKINNPKTNAILVEAFSKKKYPVPNVQLKFAFRLGNEEIVKLFLNQKNLNFDLLNDLSFLQDLNPKLKELASNKRSEIKKTKILAEAKTTNKEAAIKLLNEICAMKFAETDKELQAAALKIIQDPELEISEIVAKKTALASSAFNKLDNISKAILSHPKAKAFDKLNYYIITENNIEAIKLIDDTKTKIDGPKDLFSKSLEYAINKNNKEIVKKLLLRTDVDVQSCLSIAIHKSTEILELLLKDNRIKINARIMGDKTALDVAGIFYYKENIELLKKYGAKNGVDEYDLREPIEGEEEGQ